MPSPRRLRDRRVRVRSTSPHNLARVERFQKRTHIRGIPVEEIAGPSYSHPSGLRNILSIKKMKHGKRNIFFVRSSTLNPSHDSAHAKLVILRHRLGIHANEDSVLLHFEEIAFDVKPSNEWKKFREIKKECHVRGQGQLHGKLYHALADCTVHFSSMVEFRRALFEMYRSRAMRPILEELGRIPKRSGIANLQNESDFVRLNKLMDKGIDFLARKSVVYKKQGH